MYLAGDSGVPAISVESEGSIYNENTMKNNLIYSLNNLATSTTNLQVPNLSSCSDQSGSLPTSLNNLVTTKQPWYRRIHDSHASSSSFDCIGREFRSESHRRWSLATQKIKNILAVNDALNVSKTRQRDRERSMSIEQKSHFLDKFSTTRDRRFSGASFDLRRRADHLTDGASNISSVELRDLLNDIKESRTNISNFGDYFQESRSCKFFQILFEPYSTFIYIWSWIVILAIHYNTWVIMLRIAFPAAQQNYMGLWFSLDYTADLIYIVDVIVSSRMSFLENGIYVESVKRVTFKYFKSRLFILDLLSLLPLDLLYLYFSVNPAFRLPRLIKFFKVFQGKKLVESMTNFPNLVRGIFWLHVMFLLMHWNSCAYYIISEMEGFASNKWVYPKLEGRHTELMHRYIKCMYWSTLVLTTIGEDSPPETTIECLYMIICYITGIFIFATIVGQAGNVIQNMNASRMEFERQRDSTMQYMKEHNVPTHLQKRVRLWYDYTYSRGRFNGGDDINEVTMLPDKMKTELALHVHLETLRKVSFLQKCQPEFLHDLVLKMKLHIFTPGDFIIRKGEIAREMYVISDGMAEVVSESGRVMKVLRAGDFFGEIGLLSLSAGQNRRTADVRSCGYIELFVLSKEDVMSSIRDYPDAQRILAKHGRKRLALDSKASGGPRDETTSGSQSGSEIELKITRPDSEVSCRSIFENGAVENNMVLNETPDTKIDMKDSNDNEIDEKEENGEKSPVPKFLTSPRNSVYLDTPNHKPRAPISSQSNVIGPASSLKSLDKRLLEDNLTRSLSRNSRKQSVTRGCKSPSSSSSDEESDCKNIFERFLRPRTKNHMQRSNSDMQRRPRTMPHRSRRYVFSDGEEKKQGWHNGIEKRNLSQSVSSQHFTKHLMNKKRLTQTRIRSEDELFLRSMRKLYYEATKHIKEKTQSQVKHMKRKLTSMEQTYIENFYAKEKQSQEREEDLRRELSSVEDQLYTANQQLRQKEEELKMKEDLLRNGLVNDRQSEEQARKFQRNNKVIHI